MKPRNAGAIVVLAAVALLFANKAPGQIPTAPVAPAGATDAVTARANAFLDWFPAAAGHVAGAITWVTVHPVLLGFAAVLVVLVAVIRLVRAHRPITQDPQRMYTPEQRKEGFSYAGGQCEYTGFLLTRCRKPAEHADHLYPWSKGGATSLANMVAACSHCNLSKGAKILPPWRVRLLVRRRKRYYPAGVKTAVGQMYTERFATV